jgi:hypothetical protein
METYGNSDAAGHMLRVHQSTLQRPPYLNTRPVLSLTEFVLIHQLLLMDQCLQVKKAK